MHEEDHIPLEPLALAHHAQISAQQPRRRGRVVETVVPKNVAQSRTGPEGVPVDVTKAFANVFAVENDDVFSASAAVTAFAHIKAPKL